MAASDHTHGGVIATGPAHERMAELADASGLRRIQVLTMRAFDDPERGGAEEHADQVARHWAASGIEVQVRAAAVPGRPATTRDHGYRVVRRGGAVTVFPRSALAAVMRRDGRWDAVMEVSHGLPFWSPVWTRQPKVLFVHHVLQGVWHLQTSGLASRLGEVLERSALPRLYRSTAVMVPSLSTRDALVQLGLPEDQIGVALNGIAERFSPGASKAPEPVLVAVGRLTPQKGFDRLVRMLALLGRPEVRLQIIGDGRSLSDLQRLAAEQGVADQVSFLGQVDDDTLVESYRRAWLLVTGSHREGWGLTITEAAACGTPCVATRISGHVDAVIEGVTGELVEDADEMAAAVAALLDDPVRLERLAAGARARAADLQWDSVAEAILQRLADQTGGGAAAR